MTTVMTVLGCGIGWIGVYFAINDMWAQSVAAWATACLFWMIAFNLKDGTND